MPLFLNANKLRLLSSTSLGWDFSVNPSLPSFLSHSRPSLAMMFDAAGKLTYAPNNLLLNSATLSTQTVTVQSGVNYLMSIKGTGSVTLSGASTAGPLTGTGAGNRVDLKITASTSALTITVSGSVTSARLSAVTYETAFRSGDDVDTTSAAYYGPRIDYDPTTLAVRGLLVEPSATNYWTNSEDATAWIKNNITATVAPAGLYGSVALATLTVTANGMAMAISPLIAVAAGQQVSHTVTLLAGSVSTAEVGLYGLTSNWGLAADASCVVLSGPGVATRHSGGLFNITNLSESTPTLVRVTRTYQVAETVHAYVYLGSNGIRTAGETIKVGMPQTEFGAGSSYIISGASPTTRAADVVQFTGAALAALQGSAWTALVETGPIVDYVVATTTILGVNNIQTPLYVGDATHFASYNGSIGLFATIGSSGNFLTGSVRSGIATDTSGRSIVANGGAVSSDGNRATPVAVTSAYLGSFNGERSISGPVKSFAIYSQRLPDATLQAKSVVGASY